jgi:hypothetical protein
MKINSTYLKWLPILIIAIGLSVAFFSTAVPALADLVGFHANHASAPTVERIPANDRDLN